MREGIRKGTPEYRRASFALLFAGLAIFNALYATQALLPVFTSELGMTEGQAAWTVSAATGRPGSVCHPGIDPLRAFWAWQGSHRLRVASHHGWSGAPLGAVS